MARILLGVTGSVAAIRTPDLYEAFIASGHQVRIAATRASLYFFDEAAIGPPAIPPDTLPGLPAGPIFGDRDEWPGTRYRRGDPVLHIELRKWADLLVVAPLDANTLAKFALGISDNLLSCIYRAWEREKPILLAPAMNTRMWDSPVTLRHLRQVLADHTDTPLPANFSLDSFPESADSQASRVMLVGPQSKRLACGDTGIGAMAEVATIATIVQSWAEQTGS